ncbi:MAG TPA: TfoX/Sxy family protein [Terriglobia bacterium]|nr:TfoX/Sxy family protein [Terriglobia bacterium]
MSYDQDLADRVKATLASTQSLEERRMFGGLTFLVRKKMCVSVGKERIMCRIDPAVYDAALRRRGCRPVLMKGREYRGFVHVDAKALRTDRELDYWVLLALDYNQRGGDSSAKRTQDRPSPARRAGKHR